MNLYTLVRHTGWSAKGNPQFKAAVEERGVSERDAAKIRAAGCPVYFTWIEAERAAEMVNYPPGVEGLIPQARGGFVRLGLDEEVYVPAVSERP